MKQLEGDLISLAEEGYFDVVVHGCNCFCAMGSGIAKTIKDKYPLAYQVDRQTEKGSRDKLGTYSFALVGKGGSTSVGIEREFIIVNAYTQYSYSRNKVDVDYDALKQVFAAIKRDFAGKRIGYPLIGAGLAGGDWNIIEAIIRSELQGEDHTLVKFKSLKIN